MALNETEAEQRRAANASLKKKMRLEPRVRNEFKELFRVMSSDLTAFYSRTGQVPNPDVYVDDIRGILSRHYRRVSNAFSGSVIDFLRKNENNESEPTIAALGLIAAARGMETPALIDEFEGSVIVEKQEFITRSVNENTADINETNATQMAAAVASAITLLNIDLDRPPTQLEVGVQAGSNFRTRTASRPQTIAVTTTQQGAEGIKEIEREQFFAVRNEGALAVGIPPLQEQVVWKAVLDTHTRMSHAEADGLIRQSGFFTVQNQMLRFPGDRALGATADNVINCRCNAIVRIVE